MDEFHKHMKPKKYQETESFVLEGKATGLTILDYLRWMGSNLLDNTMRGILAEYIVSTAIGISDEPRQPWLEYDLLFNGKKLEIKSASHLQYWFQKKPSKIIFNIAPHLAWDPDTNSLKGPPMRHSDIYVFRVLETTDVDKINPLDMNQWSFYVLPLKILDKVYPSQKTLSESALKKAGISSVRYADLKRTILQVASEIS